MAIVMYYGQDRRVGDILESMLVIRNEERGQAHMLTRITDAKMLDEALVGVSFDLILIEQSFLDRPATEWLSTFKKKYSRVQSPIVLVGEENDPLKLLKLIEAGFVDYIVNPPDKLLLVEKFGLYTTGSRGRDQRQVYSLQMSRPASLAKPGVLEELSEFDCKLRTNQMTPISEMLLLYSDAFVGEGIQNAQVIGRCYESKEHPEFKGQFLCSFYFVAVTPDILTNIRNSLRKTYVAAKPKK